MRACFSTFHRKTFTTTSVWTHIFFRFFLLFQPNKGISLVVQICHTTRKGKDKPAEKLLSVSLLEEAIFPDLSLFKLNDFASGFWHFQKDCSEHPGTQGDLGCNVLSKHARISTKTYGSSCNSCNHVFDDTQYIDTHSPVISLRVMDCFLNFEKIFCQI